MIAAMRPAAVCTPAPLSPMLAPQSTVSRLLAARRLDLDHVGAG